MSSRNTDDISPVDPFSGLYSYWSVCVRRTEEPCSRQACILGVFCHIVGVAFDYRQVFRGCFKELRNSEAQVTSVKCSQASARARLLGLCRRVAAQPPAKSWMIRRSIDVGTAAATRIASCTEGYHGKSWNRVFMV